MSKLEEILLEYNKLEIKNQLDYDKFYLYSIITHSTAIEGSTITQAENEALFEKGIGLNKPIIEQFMNLDLKRAYLKAFNYAENNEPITVPLLCFLSATVMQNTGSVYNTPNGSFDSSKGELRLLNVSAGRGGRSYISWQKVEARLEELCDFLNSNREELQKNPSSLEEKLTFTFLSHYKLATIHPWADGNGRMSRLLMNMLQMELKLPLSIVKQDKRAEYIEALSKPQEEEDPTSFTTFLRKDYEENLSMQIKEYKKSMEL